MTQVWYRIACESIRKYFRSFSFYLSSPAAAGSIGKCVTFFFYSSTGHAVPASWTVSCRAPVVLQSRSFLIVQHDIGEHETFVARFLLTIGPSFIYRCFHSIIFFFQVRSPSIWATSCAVCWRQQSCCVHHVNHIRTMLSVCLLRCPVCCLASPVGLQVVWGWRAGQLAAWLLGDLTFPIPFFHKRDIRYASERASCLLAFFFCQRYYNRRGPLEYTFFRHFPRLVLGCINADFAIKDAFFSVFQNLHYLNLFYL